MKEIEIKIENKTAETKRAGAAGTVPTLENTHNTQDVMQNNNITITPECQETFEIAGNAYPVTGKIKCGDDYIPIVGIKMMSDYTWQLNCLESRIMNPSAYEGIDKNGVLRAVCRIISWLNEHWDQATEEERKRLQDMEDLFETILGDS